MSEQEPRAEERIAAEPEGDPVSTTADPLERGRWRRIGLWSLAVVVVLCLLVYGLRFYDRREEERRLERDIRNHSLNTGTRVATISLERIAKGKYKGTLVTLEGHTFDLFAEVEGDRISWIAQEPIEVKRETIRKDFEERGEPVRTLELRLTEQGVYRGQVVLKNGDEFEVCEGIDEQLRLQTTYEPNRPTLERLVREQARSAHFDTVGPVTLAGGVGVLYTGTCVGESGVTYEIRVDRQPNKKEMVRASLRPRSDHVERWLRRHIEKSTGAKVKSLSLEKRSGANYAGRTVLENGLVWEVRAGTPPVRETSAAAGLFSWQKSLAPESYPEWLRSALKAKYMLGFGPIALTTREGAHVGTVKDDNGREYRVKVWREKLRDEDTQGLWPELGGPLMWEAVPLK